MRKNLSLTVLARGVAFLCASLLTTCCDSASFDKPHRHQGLVPPYEAKAPDINLDQKALSTLKAGKLYKTQIGEAGKGRGVVIVDIHAPTTTVWSRILDHENYSKMVKGVTHSSNYEVIDHTPSRSNKYLSKSIYTRMKIGFAMVTLEYFVKHSYHPKLNVLTWTLDYSKNSDLEDTVGYWYLLSHPEKGDEWTRVFYSVDAAFPSWLPKLVQNFVSNKALGDATSWLSRESEQQYANELKQGVGGTTIPKKKHVLKKLVCIRCMKEKIVSWKKPKNRVGEEFAGSASALSTTPRGGSTTDGDETPRVNRAFMIFLIFVLILYNIGLLLEGVSTK